MKSKLSKIKIQNINTKKRQLAIDLKQYIRFAIQKHLLTDFWLNQLKQPCHICQLSRVDSRLKRYDFYGMCNSGKCVCYVSV